MRTVIALLLIFGGGYVMYIGITGNLPFIASGPAPDSGNSGESGSGPPPEGNGGGPPQNNGSSFNFLQGFGGIPPAQGIR